MKLIEQGKIGLDTDIGEVLPELAHPVVFTGYDDAGKPITVPATSKITFGQLLNHTSGLDYSLDPEHTTPPGNTSINLAYNHNYAGQDSSTFFKILKV
jgi:CubicO group peptidase (beta-lactamase class C family)